jgi:hypothetical protein
VVYPLRKHFVAEERKKGTQLFLRETRSQKELRPLFSSNALSDRRDGMIVPLDN